MERCNDKVQRNVLTVRLHEPGHLEENRIIKTLIEINGWLSFS